MDRIESPRSGDVKQLIDLAISCGRKFQNEQTGFVQYCYSQGADQGYATIPVYENMLFGLALMRSKHADTVQEGKAIIEKVLFFQNFSRDVGRGAFPIYLHEYPQCKDRLMGIRLLPVFYFALAHLHNVMGSSFKAKLISALRPLLSQCLEVHAEKPVSCTSALTLGLAAQTLGAILEDEVAVAQGKEIIRQLPPLAHQVSWYNPATLSEILIALQMGEGAALPKEWKGFWQYLIDTWHRPSCTYIGPGWQEVQCGEEPKPSLYDLYMGFATGLFSYRSFVSHPFQLQGALIYHQPEPLPVGQSTASGEVLAHRWFCSQNQGYGICLLGRDGLLDPHLEKGHIPLKVHWGDRTRARSFVCQGGNLEKIGYGWHPDGFIEMDVTLGEFPGGEDKEKAREFLFFTEALEGVKIWVSGISATTFKLGEEVSLESEGMRLTITFQLVEGEGLFMGHIMRGNRPSQSLAKGAHRLESYDWQIFLRTVQRKSPCKLKAMIQLKQV